MNQANRFGNVSQIPYSGHWIGTTVISANPAAAVGYAYLNPVNWFSPTGREIRQNISQAEGDVRERLRQGYEETDTPRFAKGATELIV